MDLELGAETFSSDLSGGIMLKIYTLLLFN